MSSLATIGEFDWKTTLSGCQSKRVDSACHDVIASVVIQTTDCFCAAGVKNHVVVVQAVTLRGYLVCGSTDTAM